MTPPRPAGVTRSILVTGATGGIGRALVNAALARGDRVLATDVGAAALEELEAASLYAGLTTRVLDVRDPLAWQEAVEEAVRDFGRLDVLLNVAGVLRPGWLHECGPGDVDLHVDVNVKGVMHGVRAASAAMVRAGSGHIVNIASLAGVAPVPGIALYSASKFAVRGLSLAAAQELAPKGVAVTVVCPDAVRTPMLALQEDREEAALTFSGSRPLEVAEVVEVVLGRVLEERPLEVLLPPGRGILARLANLSPGAAGLLRPVLERRGRRGQARERARGKGRPPPP